MAATSVLSFTPSSPWPSARFSRAHLCSPSIAAVAKDTFLWPGVLLHCWHLQIPCELAGPRLTVVHGYRAAPSSLPVASSIPVVIASPCSLGVVSSRLPAGSPRRRFPRTSAISLPVSS
uniref:Uncharacterized protein n=1 Tax=Zea mays TaxID=4577 RepID=A0A804R5A3_MAIZE